MAWLSLRRTRGLTTVMVIALSLGIGTWYAQRQVFAFLDSKIPAAPPHLYHVALGPARTLRSTDVVALLPSFLLSPHQAQRIASATTARTTRTFSSTAVI